MSKRGISLAAAVFLVASFLVTGVARAQTTFIARLGGGEEVPPNASTGTGTAIVILNAAQTMIDISVTFSGLGSNATASHVHGSAQPGVNAGVLFPVTVPPATSGAGSSTGVAITPAQVTDLQSGLFYYNVHSTVFPGGEIRAQLHKPGERIYTASLTGAQEVPPTGSAATGRGMVLLNSAATMVTLNLNFTGLGSNATAAHVHGPGAPGVNAPVIFPFAGVPAATAGTLNGQVFAISAGQVTDLNGGNHYFNVHSTTFPGGETRGQVAFSSPVELMRFSVE